MPLNEQQQRVVAAARPLAVKVIAAAGTGKTETLAARFVALVASGVPPERIVLLTYTEDAAAEMRDRVMRRLGEASLGLPPHALAGLWCHTFHGFAMRLLREYGWAIGLPPAPRLVEEEEQQQLLLELIRRWEDQPSADTSGPEEQTSYEWANGAAWDRARHVLARMRASAGTLGELAAHPRIREQQESRFAPHRAQLVPLIEYLYTAYAERLSQGGVLDHDEQIGAACRLLDTLPELSARFDAVMVDEFQDTNRAQLYILQRLCRDWSRMTVVGDPRQAIYGWRSARPDSLQQFPGAPGTQVLPLALSLNYRSREAICAIANLALVGSDLAGEAPLEPARDDASGCGRPDIALYLLPTLEDEARLVAGKMARLIATGVAPREMALLLRARTHLALFTEALRASGVPYRVSGGSGFFMEPVVRLVSSFLQLLGDPEDRAAAAHILESPLVGLDPRDLYLRQREPGAPPEAWWRWLTDPAAQPDLPECDASVRERLRAFPHLFAQARARALVLAPADFLLWLFPAGGPWEWQDGDMERVRRDWNKLVALADEWRAAEPGVPVAGYAERLRGAIDEQPREPVPIEHAANAVDIVTVHGAKGREWPVVFVAATDLPSTRSGQVDHVLWDEHWKLVISDGSSGPRGKGSDPLGELRRDLKRRGRNEERAIWYVALTRARDRLVVTHSRCQVDETGHFGDARAKLDSGAPDDTIHFFHELWELVRDQRERLAEAVFWGPGPCSGAEGAAELP